MKKTQLKISTVATLALLAAFGLSACGKNMNLALKGGLKGAGNTPGGDITTDKEAAAKKLAAEKAAAEKNKKVAGADAPTGDDKKKVGPGVSEGYPDLDGKLQPLSVFDMRDPDLASAYPYLNKVKGADGVESLMPVRHIGDELASENGFVTRGNLVFRAIKHIPKKELVKSILNFSLELNGVTLHNPKDLDRKTLAKQILCMMDKHVCIGQKAEESAEEKANLNALFWNTATVKSESMSKLPMAGASHKLGEANLLTSAEEPLKINLLEALGLDKLTIEQQMDWIEANTTLFIDPNYRKFRFVLANNVYVKAGKMILQFEMKSATDDVAKPDLKDVKNGADDLLDASKVVATPADSDKTLGGGLTNTSGNLDKVEPAVVTDPAKVTDPKVTGGGLTNTDPIIVPAPIVTDVAGSTDADDIAKLADISLDLYNKVLTFAVDSDVVAKKSDRTKLAKTAALLKSKGNSIGAIYVTGHTSVTAPQKLSKAEQKAYNQRLSVARAKRVSGYLLGGKVQKSLIKPEGKGSPERSSCAPKNECELDRKVVIKISLHKNLKKAGSDPVVLKQLRDSLVTELQKIWEANTKVAE